MITRQFGRFLFIPLSLCHYQSVTYGLSSITHEDGRVFVFNSAETDLQSASLDGSLNNRPPLDEGNGHVTRPTHRLLAANTGTFCLTALN